MVTLIYNIRFKTTARFKLRVVCRRCQIIHTASKIWSKKNITCGGISLKPNNATLPPRKYNVLLFGSPKAREQPRELDYEVLH
jgi:hypothetical protein